MLLRSDMFDCSGYYFHLRHAHEKRDGAKYCFGCPASVEYRPAVRDPSTIQRYTAQKEYLECHGELQISFSQANASANSKSTNILFHMTDEVRIYITSHKNLPPRQIYQNLTQLTSRSSILTRQQAYNFWISLTRGEWQRDAADDFKSAQLAVVEQNGYELVEDLHWDFFGVSYPCFTDRRKFNRAKMTEIFNFTFGTNKHGFERYCGIRFDGKRGSRLAQWFMASRNVGLKPKFVHTDKDIAGMKPLCSSHKRTLDS
ncbi:hypothetical protein V1527DRAFT_498313 [Lipomyces starkeyi]